jgi:hypothetical protein
VVAVPSPIDPTQGAQQYQPALDLTGSRVAWDGSNLIVHVRVADLSNISSPNTLQPNVWYLTVWQFNHTIYFARAQVDLTGSMSFAAGPAKSFDRVGLNAQTDATMVDYSGGSTVQGATSGNDISITVPASLVGNPKMGDMLESVASYTALDNGLPLFVGPGTGNIPTITNSTPAYDVAVAPPGLQSVSASFSSTSGGLNQGGSTAPSSGLPNTAGRFGGGVAALALLVLGVGAHRGRRRRRSTG